MADSVDGRAGPPGVDSRCHHLLSCVTLASDLFPLGFPTCETRLTAAPTEGCGEEQMSEDVQGAQSSAWHLALLHPRGQRDRAVISSPIWILNHRYPCVSSAYLPHYFLEQCYFKIFRYLLDK